MNGQLSQLNSPRFPLTSALEESSLRWPTLPELGDQVRWKGDFVSPLFLYAHADETFSQPTSWSADVLAGRKAR